MTNVRSAGRNILLGREHMQTVKSENYDDHPYLLSSIDRKKKAFQSGDAKNIVALPHNLLFFSPSHI